MKIKTSELTGAALDWAVARCGNVEPDENNKSLWFGDGDARVEYTPSTDWAQGGPIIEREGIELTCTDEWKASMSFQSIPCDEDGPTPLVAAMRCYVASKLGVEVKIPEELTT